MPIVFSNSHKIVAVQESAETGCAEGLIMVGANAEESPIHFQETRCFVNSMELKLSEGVQYQHTGGDKVFVYVFGSRVGSMTLRGFTVECACPEDGGPNVSGIVKFFEWYHNNKASAREQPIELLVGGQPFRVVTVGAELSAVAVASIILQWSLSFGVLP